MDNEMLRSGEAHQLRESDLELLRQRWDEGKASGRAGRLNIRRLIAEEHARFDSGEDGCD